MTETQVPTAATLEDKAKSAAHALQTAMDHVIDRAEAAVDTVGVRASAAAAKLGDDAKDNIAAASGRAEKVVNDVSPYLRERPYLALGAAAAAGVVIGLLTRGSKPRADASRKA